MKRFFLSILFILSLALPSINSGFTCFAYIMEYPENYKGWQKMYDIKCGVVGFDYAGIECDEILSEVLFTLYGKSIGGKISYRILYEHELITIQRGHWLKSVVRYYRNSTTGRIYSEKTVESFNSRFLVRNSIEGTAELMCYCNLDY